MNAYIGSVRAGLISTHQLFEVGNPYSVRVSIKIGHTVKVRSLNAKS